MSNMTSYVTYDVNGSLDGSYFQVPPEEHAGRMIIVDDITREAWFNYRANIARDGLELIPPVAPDLVTLKAAKKEQINIWRAAANLSTFPHAGKEIACDALSRSDIDGVANNIALSGAFPAGFPGAWKTIDNTFIPVATVDDFKAMYASMTAQGSTNFSHAQSLKAQVDNATTEDEIAAVVW